MILADARLPEAGGGATTVVYGAANDTMPDPVRKRRFPIVGDVMIGTEGRGALNAKAKRELGWVLRYPSWRQGFYQAYAGVAGDKPAEGAARSPLTSPAPRSR